MTTIDIDAIRQREQAATEGPWIADEWEIYSDPTRDWIAETLDTDDPERSRADAAFIAHARTDVPALLAKVDELTAGLADVRAKFQDALWTASQHAGDAKEALAELEKVRAELTLVTDQRDAARAMADELRDDLRAADDNNGFLQQHIADIRAEAAR